MGGALFGQDADERPEFFLFKKKRGSSDSPSLSGVMSAGAEHASIRLGHGPDDGDANGTAAPRNFEGMEPYDSLKRRFRIAEQNFSVFVDRLLLPKLARNSGIYFEHCCSL